MNEVFCIHHNGQLIKVYRRKGTAKSYMTRLAKQLKAYNRESEINNYEMIRYVPELNVVPKHYTI